MSLGDLIFKLLQTRTKNVTRKIDRPEGKLQKTKSVLVFRNTCMYLLKYLIK